MVKAEERFGGARDGRLGSGQVDEVDQRLAAAPVKVLDVWLSAEDHRKGIEAVRILDQDRIPTARAHAVNVGRSFAGNARDDVTRSAAGETPHEILAAQARLEAEVHPTCARANGMRRRRAGSKIVGELQQIARLQRFRIEAARRSDFGQRDARVAVAHDVDVGVVGNVA